MSLKIWRKSKGWNQTKLAGELGFTQPTISKIERDEAHMSERAALTILDKLGIKVGPLADATDSEISFVRRVYGAEAAAQ